MSAPPVNRITELMKEIDSRMPLNGLRRDFIVSALETVNQVPHPNKYRTFKSIVDTNPHFISDEFMFIRKTIQAWDRNHLFQGSGLPPMNSRQYNINLLSSSSLPLSANSSSSSSSLPISGSSSSLPISGSSSSLPISGSSSSLPISVSSSSIPSAPVVKFPLSNASQFLNFIPSTFQDVAPQPIKVETPRPPKMTSFDYVYNETDSKLDRHKCPICIHVAVSPVSVSCCGQIYCDECFNQTFLALGYYNNARKYVRCVTCKAEIAQSIRIPSGFLNYFDDLSVKCQTCQLSHPRGHFNQHWLHECKTPCSNQCGHNLSRAELSTHATICPLAITTCTYLGCRKSHQIKDHSDHINLCKYKLLNNLTTDRIMELAIQQLQSTKSSQ